MNSLLEIIIKRLESIEETFVAIKEQQAETNQQLVTMTTMILRTSKLSDSERTLGVAFSGSNWCDHPVKLIVNGTFGEEGRFGKGLMIVEISAQDADLTCQFWDWDHEWNQHIMLHLGHEQYNRVKTNVLEFYSKDSENCAKSQEVGITGTEQQYADDALFEIALQKRHKGLVAIGADRIATSFNTLHEVIALVDKVCEDMKTGVTTKLVFYPINAKLKKLALAMVRRTGVQGEFLLLNFEQQQILQRNYSDPLSFFHEFTPLQNFTDDIGM